MDSLPRVTAEMAKGYARLACAGLQREYPNAPQLLLESFADMETNRSLHPAFYGCFDWHSAVHSHWLLVRWLRSEVLDLETSAEARRVLDAHLTPANLDAELHYFSRPLRGGFEFPYGWAWLVRLWHECGRLPDGAYWRSAIDPLAEYFITEFEARVASLVGPLRSGAHRDLGFSLAIVFDVLKLEGRHHEHERLGEHAKRLYGGDRDYPWEYEPSGYDFTSSGLNEVLVMRRVLSTNEFSKWLAAFWPSLDAGVIGPIARPVVSPDILDGQGSHIVGLSLSRSWAFAEIATYLDHALKGDFQRAAAEHLQLGLSSVHSGGYMGEHWLATFATFALTAANQDWPNGH